MAPSRRTVLACLAVTGLAGCLDSSSDDNDDDEVEEEEPTVTLETEGVVVEVGVDSIEATTLEAAEHIYLRGITGQRERYTLEAEGDSTDVSAGHYRVYADEDPEDFFGETHLGTVRIGEPTAAIDADWLETDPTADNAAEDDGLVQSDPAESFTWTWEFETDEPVGEVEVRVDPERSSGEFQLRTRLPDDSQVMGAVLPGEVLEQQGIGPTRQFHINGEAGSYEVELTADPDEPVAVVELTALAPGPPEILED